MCLALILLGSRRYAVSRIIDAKERTQLLSHVDKAMRGWGTSDWFWNVRRKMRPTAIPASGRRCSDGAETCAGCGAVKLRHHSGTSGQPADAGREFLLGCLFCIEAARTETGGAADGIATGAADVGAGYRFGVDAEQCG